MLVVIYSCAAVCLLLFATWSPTSCFSFWLFWVFGIKFILFSLLFSSSFVPSLFLRVRPPSLGTSCFTLVVCCDFAVFLLHLSNCFDCVSRLFLLASLPFVFSASFFPRPLCSRPHYLILSNISAPGENVCFVFLEHIMLSFFLTAFGSPHRYHVPHSWSSQFQIWSLVFSLLKHIIYSSFFNWTVERLRCAEEG